MPAVRAKHEQLASEQGRPKMIKGKNQKVHEQPAEPTAPPPSE